MVPHANPNIDDNGICHRNSWGKNPMYLVFISHKYSQRDINLGLNSVADVKTCFPCNQKVKKLSVVCKIMVLVKKWVNPS